MTSRCKSANDIAIPYFTLRPAGTDRGSVTRSGYDRPAALELELKRPEVRVCCGSESRVPTRLSQTPCPQDLHLIPVLFANLGSVETRFDMEAIHKCPGIFLVRIASNNLVFSSRICRSSTSRVTGAWSHWISQLELLPRHFDRKFLSVHPIVQFELHR